MEPRQLAPGRHLPSRLDPRNRCPLAPSGHLLDTLLSGWELRTLTMKMERVF